MSDRPIHLVLDVSSILAYATGESIDVGETIAEVADEQGGIGLPVACLAEAFAVAPDTPFLDVLVRHSASVRVGLAPDDWQALGAMLGTVAPLGAASAALLAVDSEAPILTRTPELYEGLDGGGDIIAF